jgi:hypothetical protein
MDKLPLRTHLTFGFEMTFTLERWWESPGFCSECETDQKTEIMRELSLTIAKKLGLISHAIKDRYDLSAFRISKASGEEVMMISPEPGSIELNTPPVLLDQVGKLTQSILDLCLECGLVPYRKWWYGILTGTGGGCHFNMAGFTEDTNPFKNDLGLVLRYFSFFHNHPSLHYPFMGSDLGQGGNCMRMDEHGARSHENFKRFEQAVSEHNSGWEPTGEELYEYFKDFPLREVKHSAPTLRKMTKPYYLIEDRAVEMPRSGAEFSLLCELRMRILEMLQSEDKALHPKTFGPELHQEVISYAALWDEFQTICLSLKMDPAPYHVFFERQFPKLECGEGLPKSIIAREGKRERKVLGAEGMLGSLILSKKIDTRFKRIELQANASLGWFRVNGRKFRAHPSGNLLDLFVPANGNGAPHAVLDMELYDTHGTFVERAVLDLNSMMFRQVDPHRFWPFQDLPECRYYSFEDDLGFTTGV